MALKIGVDVGGTNTDAVILDDSDHLLAKFKTATSPDVTTGIRAAIVGVLAASPRLDRGAVRHAMLGTTHCTNAIVERRGLNRVGVIRIGAPATLAIKPMTGWPADLRASIGRFATIVGGGHEFDGREIAALDERGVREAVQRFGDEVDSVAIASVFAPVDASHEERAAILVRELLGPAIPVSLSHEIGSIGLLERENATILNAAVVSAARIAANAFRDAMEAEGIDARLYFTQNDGTLMALEYATRYPILTVASGPANSIRGAAFLSGLQDTLVVDIGGTSADVGVLARGFPRQSAVAVEIGGVRTNFRMPDLLAIGLGGGTRVHRGGDELRLGPDSVGYRLREEGLVFGGRTLTLSDVAVATGRATMGDASRVAGLDPRLVQEVGALTTAMLESAIDRMKTSAAAMPVVLVGGGSVIVADELAGVSAVYRPANFDVANAIGAAIAQCSGEIERVFALETVGRDQALEQARQLARAEAIRAGADPSNVEIVELEEVPLAYLPGSATRIKARAAGPLAR